MAKQATANSDAVAAELRALDASLDFLDEGVAESFGIKRSDLRAIEVVSRRGRLTAGQLAEELGTRMRMVSSDCLQRHSRMRRRCAMIWGSMCSSIWGSLLGC